VEISQDKAAWFAAQFNALVANIGRVIQGKQEAIEQVVSCMLAEGHLLIEDVPGVGKTLLAKSLARSIECEFNRIQFTPDLLPSDITGVSVWDRSRSEFVFKPGAIFANIVVGDEINRASPKTQAALLEAMEERQVTTDGITRPLAAPFMVVATQNPLEHEGTYPLPEAQLDRFMMRTAVGYPDRQHELEILDTHGITSTYPQLTAMTNAHEIGELIVLARTIKVAHSVKGYVVDLIEATRIHPDILLGASPRAALYLLRVSRVRAASQAREYVTPDDVKEYLHPVLGHRLILRPEAQIRGAQVADVVDSVIASLQVPSAIRAASS